MAAAAMKESVANLELGRSMMNDELIEDGRGPSSVARFVPSSSYSRLSTISVSVGMGEEGGIAHVSPRRKLDTDWRFSTTTTTLSAAALSPSLLSSPLLSPPSERSPVIIRHCSQREGQRASGVWGKKERRGGREGEVLRAGRE